ncbi:MAG: hemerythrin domain-containing protein [Rhodobacteraceae bacterium]|nr:hemerythrin domain-containing protein [Paracoccaceae bacterium]
MDDLDLMRRAGLPDALRVLVTEMPRAEWEAHPAFRGLAEFWLDRHMMFRKLAALLRADAEARLDGGLDPAAHVARVGRYGGLYLGELQGHHAVEDAHYFPVMAGLDARVARGFELLDADHHALDALLAEFADRANAVIRDGGAARDAAGRLLETVTRMEGFIDRHLIDEEEIVVPLILAHRLA